MYAFGPFRVDLRAGQLTRDGVEIDVEPVVFALLVYFLRHPQRLIPRQELLDELWKETHVSDASLSRAIAKLREALGDGAREPRYIETVPRRGYRFLASVVEPKPAACRLVHGTREFVLTPGVHIIGRGHDCGICIESTDVSRHHAQLTVTATGASIKDLGSRNGTTVAGRRLVKSHDLHDGEEIRLGSISLKFHAPAVTEQAETTPPKE